MAAGYAAYRVRWLSPEADSSLLRVVVNLLYPCLILHTVLTKPAELSPSNLLLPPLAGFATAAFGFVASYAAAPLFGIEDERRRRTFAFTTGLYNYGYIALPVVQSLFGPGATTILFIHNVGVEAALWTVGIVMLAGTSPGEAWKHIFTPPVLAIAGALALYFGGARHWMPPFLLSALQMLGGAAIPLGLVLTGATFADQARSRTTAPAQPSGHVALGCCVLRLGLLPLTLLALARWLPCAPELRQVLHRSRPQCASRRRPRHPRQALRRRPLRVALQIVLVTSALGLVTIPLWLQFGLWVIS